VTHTTRRAAASRSLFADPAKPKNAKWKAMDWKRAVEMGVKNPRLFTDGMNADDIKQVREYMIYERHDFVGIH
jgi:hypothetical protein